MKIFVRVLAVMGTLFMLLAIYSVVLNSWYVVSPLPSDHPLGGRASGLFGVMFIQVAQF